MPRCRLARTSAEARGAAGLCSAAMRSLEAKLDLNQVSMFVRVVDRGGFAAVGRELGVPTSTVSRAVARLEETLSTPLLTRTTRNLRPTAEGRAFYQEAAPALASLARAARGIEPADRAPRGKLRVTAPNDIGATFLADVVVEFTARHPHVQVETVLTTRTLDLVAEGIDVALRAAPKLADSSLIAKKLGSLQDGLYASPDFNFVRAMLLGGAGIGLLPQVVAAPDVDAGRLVRLLPNHARRTGNFYVVHPAARTVPAKIVAFREMVVEAFARRGCETGTRATGKKS
jgi:DNA-binding transcriptional LysR family regulator